MNAFFDLYAQASFKIDICLESPSSYTKEIFLKCRSLNSDQMEKDGFLGNIVKYGETIEEIVALLLSGRSGLRKIHGESELQQEKCKKLLEIDYKN